MDSVESEGRRLLADLLTVSSMAADSDWATAQTLRALGDASVGASRSLREALVLATIELAQLAPRLELRHRHLLFAARLAESLTWSPMLPRSFSAAHSGPTQGRSGELNSAAPPLGTAADWTRVIGRIHDSVEADLGRETISIARSKARIRSLAPGQRAPRFVARDTAGNEVRSTDFEGKIVLYRFWSDSSPAAIAAHQQDLALLRRFWDTPFDLVGISADPQRASHLNVVAEARLGGTQIYDGPIGTTLVDALARAGNRTTAPTSSSASWGFPTVGSTILVDSLGVVRAHDLHGPALAGAIDALVVEHRMRLREERLTGQKGD